VSTDWIQGLESFQTGVVGVEGKTYYVSEKYVTTFSDSVIQNKHGGQFMTCNVAYEKSALEKVKGFDERYQHYFEDRDLAFRVRRIGKIVFNPSMIVYHQKVTMAPRNYLKRAQRIRDRVLLFKRFQDRWS
jgi:GT2 family glycosyltransferase